ncbi:uncharacterized protein TRIADDRAFT_52770 [Trichoplax adhaerens]|uniref:Uncharacterized protein n=1 Tax=Trichoplax adhaerens TaxID=10228 RepID=B3RKA2_TRIAD|nr:predicted protein [Trichoplax adhaerens]EDV29889.1 predicted protein [Trichoplax adhaerens]|eukprot:XP_002109091.1 predicted protein [Trichoplax adhaerens]
MSTYFIALNGYPQITELCTISDNHTITLPEIPQLRLFVPKKALKDNLSITLTTFYTDAPYIFGLPVDDGEHLIYLSPIIRLEPDGYHFGYQESFEVMLRLPIPSASELCQYFKVDNIKDLPLKLGHRSQEDKVWNIQKLDYQSISIQEIENTYCINVPIQHFSDYLIYIKSAVSVLFKHIFPSYQQEIKAVAYLSPIDSYLKTTHLKIVILSKNVDDDNIMQNIPEPYRRIALSPCGLEDVILENGSYKIEFKNGRLLCEDKELMIRTLTVNWNERVCYHLDYDCKVLNPNDPLTSAARITIKPRSNQNDQTLKSLTLMKPSLADGMDTNSKLTSNISEEQQLIQSDVEDIERSEQSSNTIAGHVRAEAENEKAAKELPENAITDIDYQNESHLNIFPGFIPALNGYPQITELCTISDNHTITLPEIPQLRLFVPKKALKDNLSITLTTFYTDAPYIFGLPVDDGEHLIYLSPIIRLEPDGYHFGYQESFEVMLRLPIPSASELCQYFKVDNIKDLPLKLGHRSQEDKVWNIQKLDYQSISIQEIENTYCINVPIQHFSDYLIYIKSAVSVLFKHIFPSYQQEIKAVAYLSPIDSYLKTTHLKIVILSKNVDDDNIMQNIPEPYRRIALSPCGLEDVILENGSYKIEFKNGRLLCEDKELMIRTLTVNWNERVCYHLDYDCKVLNPNDPLTSAARITIKPRSNQNDQTLKSLTLMKVY